MTNRIPLIEAALKRVQENFGDLEFHIGGHTKPRYPGGTP
jgi:hypothetical protein